MSPLRRYIFPKTHLNFYYYILRGSWWSTEQAGRAQEGNTPGPGQEDLCMLITGAGIVSSTIVYFRIKCIS